MPTPPVAVTGVVAVMVCPTVIDTSDCTRVAFIGGGAFTNRVNVLELVEWVGDVESVTVTVYVVIG